MVGRFIDRPRAALVELRAQARVRAWTLSYMLEMRQQTALREQRKLASAAYSLLLTFCRLGFIQ